MKSKADLYLPEVRFRITTATLELVEKVERHFSTKGLDNISGVRRAIFLSGLSLLLGGMDDKDFDMQMGAFKYASGTQMVIPTTNNIKKGGKP